MRYHVHVYEVKKKYEVDLEGEDEVGVRLKAIELYNNKRAELKEVDLDCRVIVFSFVLEESRPPTSGSEP